MWETKLSFELTEKHNMEIGIFDNVAITNYSILSHWDIGKVYKRLIIEISKKENKPLINALSEVYNSWLSRKIEDFNSESTPKSILYHKGHKEYTNDTIVIHSI